MLGLLGLQLSVVELQLLALQDVAVGAAALARARGEDGEQATGLELLLEDGVELGGLFALLEDALDVVGLLGVGLGLGELGAARGGLRVVRLVPLTEGGRVNVDDGRLDEGLGTEQLVVGGVVPLGC